MKPSWKDFKFMILHHSPMERQMAKLGAITLVVFRYTNGQWDYHARIDLKGGATIKKYQCKSCAGAKLAMRSDLIRLGWIRP